jgi:UDP-N-acetylmuramyl-tripeptide synthetase
VLAGALARMRRDLTGVLTIGITGTKGKTSTTEFIGQLMAARGLRTAVSTSESARIGSRSVAVCEHLGDLAAFVRRCRGARVECLVVELCSFALRWNVHRGFDLDAAVLTNVGTDHISDHGNVRNYVAVKRRMFRDLRAGPARPAPVAIVNADDARAREFRGGLGPGVRVTTYSLGARNGSGPSRVWATSERHGDHGTSFTVHGLAGRPLACRTRLHGDFNVANVLAALACAVALGGDPRRTVAAAATLAPPPGRFTIVGAGTSRRPAVVVDYAHTPESVGAALAAARDLRPRGRVHAVFGCGGDCYKGKRPLMGAVAARRADSIVVTSDNPRTEDPRSIARAILRGIPPSRRRDVRVELDRARAIHQAVAGAAAGDVVVLLGKGAERTQEIAGKTSPFSDLRVARRALDAHTRLC